MIVIAGVMVGILIGWGFTKKYYYELGKSQLERDIVNQVLHSDDFDTEIYNAVKKAFSNARRGK